MARYNESERGSCVLSHVQNTSRCDLRACVRSRGLGHNASHELPKQTRSYPRSLHQPFCYRIRHRCNPTAVARLGRGTPHRCASQLARCHHYESCCPHPQPGSCRRLHHWLRGGEIRPMIHAASLPSPAMLPDLSPLECALTKAIIYLTNHGDSDTVWGVEGH